MRITAAAAFLSALVAVTISAPAAGAPGPTPRPDNAAPPPLADAAGPSLGDCPALRTLRGFRCGRIQVPFERADPSLGTTRIGFAVRPRSDRSRPSLGTIFAVEGGPGYSSTGSAKYFTRLFRDLLDRHDLVLADTRGTGISDALLCGNSQKTEDPAEAGRPPMRNRARPPLLLLSHPGRRGGPRGGSPGPRARRHHSLRRLLRHLPRPDLRVPPRRPHPPARPGRLLPDRRRESLVRRRSAHRHPRPHPRMPTLPPVPSRIPSAPDPGGGQAAPRRRRRHAPHERALDRRQLRRARDLRRRRPPDTPLPRRRPEPLAGRRRADRHRRPARLLPRHGGRLLLQ